MNRVLLVGITIAASLSIYGCSVTSPLVVAEVTAYHTLPTSAERTTFQFLPLQGQKGGLEYQAYQDLIREQLAKHNYVEAQLGEIPQVLVSFNYAIGSPRQEVSSQLNTVQTGTMVTGSWAGNAGSMVSTPTYGHEWSTSASTVYDRSLWFGVANYADDPTAELVMRYEGQVISTGSDGQLNAVFDEMAEALFKDFPGESGKTRTVYLNGWD